MSILTVHPFEGFPLTPGGDWSASHLGQDYHTPRIYDYTAASDGVVEATGGTFHQIIVRRSDGTRWRLAEVATILVSVGQTVKLGQVIGRNAYYRGGIYRSPHLNAGGDSGRSKFTGIVTATKAQAAAIIAAQNAPKPGVRIVKAGINAVRRMGPGTKYAKTGTVLKAGTPGNFIAFAYGPISQGQPTDRLPWFQGTSGNWFYSASFTSQSTAGLVDKTAEFAHLDTIVQPPVIETPPTPVEPEPEPEEGPIVPIPTPEPEPIPEPAPAPEPEPIPDPVPAPEPVPTPEPVPDPTPAPSPVPPKTANLTGLVLLILGAIGSVLAVIFGR